MPGGYYCETEGCNWEGLTAPPSRSCPRCSGEVVAHAKKPKKDAPLFEETAAEATSESPSASVTYALDLDAWKPWTTARGRKYYASFASFGAKLARLLTEKQLAYGDSFGQAAKVLAVLYPDGVSVEQYSDLLTITRVIDKLFRVANQKEAFGENPWRDIAGYAVLACVADQQDDEEQPSSVEDSGEPITLSR